MTLRSLLVHMDGAPRCAARLTIARDLARRHEAHLAALYAATPPLVAMPYAYAASAVALNVLQDVHVQRLARAKQTYDAAGVEGSWSELAVEPPVEGFARQARLADLLVLGQNDAGAPLEQEVPGDFVESVLIASGRPALVVPYVGNFPTVGERALIAWKDSAESARALAGALPLLRQAKQVDVALWGGADAPVAGGQTLDLPRYLALHGIQARLHRESREPDNVGESLLSLAADVSADLLVMGCYGHSRAREFVLGGASRTVLRSMTVPVLMSH